MNFKKVILITAFLSVVLFWCAPAVRAQTLEELSTQIVTIRNQIVNYQNEIAVLQKKISNLQAEVARLLAQQISIVQNQIAQLQTELQTKTLAKPESEYKCPDLNRDGKVDLYDAIMISAKLNTCEGATNYDSRGDVDGDNCLTNTDLNFVNKNYGKKTNEIEQCKGIIIPPRSPKPESEYKCPDLNGDGTVNLYDAVIVNAKINSCEGDANYDARGDINGDGCLTEDDANFVIKHYGKKIEEISPQCVKPPDESKYKCPDLNKDGIVNLYDAVIVNAKIGSCKGTANFDEGADVDGNGCITVNDSNFITKYYGKKTTEIAQCGGVVVTPPPEPEYACPDLNTDGIVDLYDAVIISARLNTCQGATNYDSRGDVDRDGCLTTIDLNFVQKYYGKKTTEITQCEGVAITPTLSVSLSANPSSGNAPLTGVDLIASVSGTATGNINYTFYCNRADAATNIISGWCQKKDGSGQSSYTAVDCCNFYSAGTYTAKVIAERGGVQAEARKTISVNPPLPSSTKPESEYKCPDLNGDGTVDLYDAIIISARLNTCQGAANYDPRGDVDKDNCITSNDSDFVNKNYGKKAADIDQCKVVSVLDIESMMASIADAISKIAEEIGKLIR